ncbi:molybdenum cofactor sulfurase [Phyllobacterium phragmitis]|uniref:Molybdenum cofactor sulfurase n=1 Tax=Phyllobacterium phragmitis TaxID=2670329 RepID=A0A2S9IXG4_9HYPH|nr:MOSC domain-containing protein [Phyllobacterium phragmitis]PRD45217.1 molybdenum cofactor sulfurase [Phyllobacterium phragmitis]
MTDLLSPLGRDAGQMPEIVPSRRIGGKVAGLFEALHDHFGTQAADTLELTFEGIDGDYHAGLTRKSGGREPWYPRGTEMRNERQLSLVAPDELDVIAGDLGIAEVKAEWIGANMVVEGIPFFSMLPPRTLLFFEGGVTLRVDGQNAPCKIAGTSLAENAGAADVTDMAFDFVRAAKRLRGLVAWVEKPGTVNAGEKVEARIPEHWHYPE